MGIHFSLIKERLRKNEERLKLNSFLKTGNRNQLIVNKKQKTENENQLTPNRNQLISNWSYIQQRLWLINSKKDGIVFNSMLMLFNYEWKIEECQLDLEKEVIEGIIHTRLILDYDINNPITAGEVIMYFADKLNDDIGLSVCSCCEWYLRNIGFRDENDIWKIDCFLRSDFDDDGRSIFLTRNWDDYNVANWNCLYDQDLMDLYPEIAML